MMTKLLLASIFLLSTIEIYSQPGFKEAYIITNESDTVHGKGWMQPNNAFCYFKTDGTKRKVKYLPGEISAFRFLNGYYFVSKEIPGGSGTTKMWFLEFLVDGKIDLYRIGSPSRFFLEKDGDTLLELSDNQAKILNVDGVNYSVQDKKYLGFLRYYMREAPEMFERIDKMDQLNQADLVEIAEAYHYAVCKDEKCINYAKGGGDDSTTVKLRRRVTLLGEPTAGVNRHNAYYSGFYGVNLWLGFGDNFYLKGGLSVKEKIYDFKDKRKNREYTLDVPIGILYAIGKGKVRPTIAVGQLASFRAISVQGGVMAQFSDRIGLNAYFSVDGVTTLIKGDTDWMYNNDLPLSAGIGFLIRLSK